MYVSVPLKSESISYRGMGDPAQLHWLLSARNEAAFFSVKSYVSQEGKVFDKVFIPLGFSESESRESSE